MAASVRILAEAPRKLGTANGFSHKFSLVAELGVVLLTPRFQASFQMPEQADVSQAAGLVQA